MSIEPIHRIAYEHGSDPIQWAIMLIAFDLEARDLVASGQIKHGVALTLLAHCREAARRGMDAAKPPRRMDGVLMPIRPENLARYGPDWPAISWVIRWVRALGRCECRGECGRPHPALPIGGDSRMPGRCIQSNGMPVRFGSDAKVVLTVAHLDHTPENCHPANLRAMCQSCHLRYDGPHHAETRRRTLATQRVARGELALFEPAAVVTADHPARLASGETT